jgi:uncharacterized protein YyaL (SSP411 family)
MVRSVSETLPGAEVFTAKLAARLAAAVARRTTHPSRVRHRDAGGRPRFTNRLALESSPYLLQHAHNPVSWYPWGDEAFADARRLDRPVFLSVGYSTCHWCHVMEEESFEDEEVAAVLNAGFVPIKVDREERPDVDAVYMRAAQQIAGAGGWPLSVWLTPEREPFFAGTYFPPYSGRRGGQTGFVEILLELGRLYREERARVGEAARTLVLALRADEESRAAAGDMAAGPSAAALLAKAVEQCDRAFDRAHGGLRVRQKFPSQVPLRLLLRHHHRGADDGRALAMATRTLEAMATGGLYDHLTGGFHRYATDPQWLIPHFEKMLYDNAQLVVAYAEAWQVTKQPAFARVARETCEELLATFASPDGAFYCATDADSEGEEGKYFVWSEEEIRAVLGPGEETDLFLRHYGFDAGRNFELGNVLWQPSPDEEVTRRLAPARAKLAEVRGRRIAPARDEKILAGWNGLAIGAFAVAGRILDQPRYMRAARAAADFVVGRMREPATGQLARSYREGRLGPPGFLDDHAFLASGLLDLFESTGEARWLAEACRLCEEVEARFADPEAGGWFLTSGEHERLLLRERSLFDGAEPAGSSVALLNAARLAGLTDQDRWRRVCDRALAVYGPLPAEHPLAVSHALLAYDFVAGPVREVVLALPDAADEAGLAFRRVLRETFCPRMVLVTGTPGSAEWQAIEKQVPLARGKVAVGGRPTAYVCAQGRCELPATDPEVFARQLAT